MNPCDETIIIVRLWISGNVDLCEDNQRNAYMTAWETVIVWWYQHARKSSLMPTKFEISCLTLAIQVSISSLRYGRKRYLICTTILISNSQTYRSWVLTFTVINLGLLCSSFVSCITLQNSSESETKDHKTVELWRIKSIWSARKLTIAPFSHIIHRFRSSRRGLHELQPGCLTRLLATVRQFRFSRSFTR